MKFENSIAIVTGASRGIGREIAVKIAEKGARVGLIARTESGLLETKNQINDNGGKAEIFPADLGNYESVQSVASDILNMWGDIDMLVNNAGVWHNAHQIYYAPLEKTPVARISEVINVGILAPMLLTHHLLPGMIQRGKGKILQISGVFDGREDIKGWLHYYVSKKALEHFTDGLAEELREHNIQVNCISPGFVATEPVRHFFPGALKDAISSQDVARLAIFFLSGESDHITGQTIIIRGNSNYPHSPAA